MFYTWISLMCVCRLLVRAQGQLERFGWWLSREECAQGYRLGTHFCLFHTLLQRDQFGNIPARNSETATRAKTAIGGRRIARMMHLPHTTTCWTGMRPPRTSSRIATGAPPSSCIEMRCRVWNNVYWYTDLPSNHILNITSTQYSCISIIVFTLWSNRQSV